MASHIHSNFKLPQLNTERLLLRRLLPSDWKMISYLRSDKNVNEFVKRPNAESKEDALVFINKINTGIDLQNLYYWVICEKQKNDMIGSICLWNFSKDNTVAEVGYDLSPTFQCKGLMTESLKAIIRFGFYKLNLKTIEAFTHKQNTSSIKLLKKNGFKIVDGKIDKHNANNVVYELNYSIVHD